MQLQQLHKKQEANKLVAQAARSAEAIRQSTTPAELRRAYEQLPGNKAPLPEQFPQPFPVIRERLAEAITAKTNRAEYEFGNNMTSVWQRSLALALGNTLRMLIFFLGFAAIGRRSSEHPTLLESLLSQKHRGLFKILQRRRHSSHDDAVIAKEWIILDDERLQK